MEPHTTARKAPKRSLLGRLFRLMLGLTGVALVAFAVAAVVAGLWFKWNILDTLPEDLSGFRSYRPQATVVVEDRYGREIDSFYLERRVWVPLEDLPAHVPEAFIAAEDRRFWSHPGVDLAGVARAAWANFAGGGVGQGGSTLTQQLVKNLLVGKERSYTRKMREAVLAYRLDQEIGKERVLELYLNYVALGSGNYGVEAASRDYFGISARDLDPGQAALLAGLPPAPSRYSPRKNPETAKERRRLVLRAMVEAGYLAPEDREAYQEDPVILVRYARPISESDAAYRTEVRREVRAHFGEAAFDNAGIRVRSSMDSEVQRVAVEAIRGAIEAHHQRQGPRVPLRRLSPDQADYFLRSGAGLAREPSGAFTAPAPGACLEGLIGPRGGGQVLVGTHEYTLDTSDLGRIVANPDPELPGLPVRRVVRPGDVVEVCMGEVGAPVRLADRPWAEGAAVVIDHRSGEVVAVVGGYESSLGGFVRATQARRQPGSSFKPYVYGAALARGRTQLDTVVDSPISLPAGNGRMWTPKNYGGGYAGALRLRSALARSLNTVAVRLAIEVGPARVAEMAYASGVRTPLRTDLTMALGASEVTPFDQAMGYATIARGGRPVEPVWIREVLDADGEPLGRAGTTFTANEIQVSLPGKEGEPAMDPGVAYELADMLREVVRGGTARRAYEPTRDRAGKTGTTNGFVDAWFVGFTPRYAVAVWIGTDANHSLGRSETGGRAALPAWMQIVSALEEPEGERRPAPPEAMLLPHEGSWVAVGRGRAGRLLPATSTGFSPATATRSGAAGSTAR